MSLAAHGIAFGYGERLVGRGIDLSVADGELVCLLGPNGAGKSSLLRAVVGLLELRAGEVTVDGHALASLRAAQRAQRIAYVAQQARNAFAFPVAQVVLMGRVSRFGAFGAPAAADRRAADEALARLGIDGLRAREMAGLSGGEQQLVRIARALAQGAGTIVLDEPTANLDIANELRVLAVLRELADSGLAILMASHDPNHALSIGDQVALVRDAGILRSGPPAQALDGSALMQTFGVAATLASVPGEPGRSVFVPAVPPRSRAAPAPR